MIPPVFALDVRLAVYQVEKWWRDKWQRWEVFARGIYRTIELKSLFLSFLQREDRDSFDQLKLIFQTEQDLLVSDRLD